MTRPIIGISCHQLETELAPGYRNTGHLLPASYAEAIAKAGGIAVLLPPYKGTAADLVAKLDGIVIAGGEDLDPKYYNERPHESTEASAPERDVFELELIAAARAANVPLLGVCRGMQVLNVALGGTLYQHIPELSAQDSHNPVDGKGADRYGYTDASINTDSKVGKALGESSVVRCHHHQSVRELGKDLIQVAAAPDGIVEAFEHATDAFTVGVQWHPERNPDDVRIFAALIAQATAR